MATAAFGRRGGLRGGTMARWRSNAGGSLSGGKTARASTQTLPIAGGSLALWKSGWRGDMNTIIAGRFDGQSRARDAVTELDTMGSDHD